MNQAFFLCLLEVKETLRARWYQFYILTVTLIISLFFYFGLIESRVMGFMGLSRMLLTLIQICIILLPIFAIITTVRTFVGDREAGIWEYNLSIPIKLSSFYWGRGLGRFISLFLPLLLGFGIVVLVSLIKGIAVPWSIVFIYIALIGSNLLCFTGIALCLSIYAKNQEMALGLGFIIWLVSEAFIDVLLLGLLLKQSISGNTVLGLAFLNPLQTFRMASIGLFDPELTVLGPIAYTIVEKIGLSNLMIWAITWPVLIGLFFAMLGYRRFYKKDLI